MEIVFLAAHFDGQSIQLGESYKPEPNTNQRFNGEDWRTVVPFTGK